MLSVVGSYRLTSNAIVATDLLPANKRNLTNSNKNSRHQNSMHYDGNSLLGHTFKIRMILSYYSLFHWDLNRLQHYLEKFQPKCVKYNE